MSVSVLEKPGVQSFIVYSGILGVKVLAMSLLTGRVRFSKKIFANPEDTTLATDAKVIYNDPDVERVRRSHLNDVENIPVFWVLGALYLTTNPSAEVATNLFRAYAAGRILHTLVYAVKPLPQPARALSFGIPYFICYYMGFRVILHYSGAL